MICTLCPRRCGVDRSVRTGFCGLGENMLIARIAPHLWEEPPVSGSRGTGAVFFSGCTLRCAYCQNGEISHRNQGRPFTPRGLADSLKRLEDLGMQSISLITATPFVPAILDALSLYRPSLPLVWNSSGYESLETLRMLNGIIDVYLPDLKHYSSRMGALCAGAPDYFAVASRAIPEMCRQTGSPVYDENGIMLRGTLPPGTPVSLMRQYLPCNNVQIPGLQRPVSEAEYRRVRDHMLALDLPGFLQESASVSADFIPLFNQPESFI